MTEPVQPKSLDLDGIRLTVNTIANCANRPPCSLCDRAAKRLLQHLESSDAQITALREENEQLKADVGCARSQEIVSRPPDVPDVRSDEPLSIGGGLSEISWTALINITPGAFSDVARPANVKDVWVLRWPDARIEIPWPKGISALEAVRQWKTVREDA